MYYATICSMRKFVRRQLVGLVNDLAQMGIKLMGRGSSSLKSKFIRWKLTITNLKIQLFESCLFVINILKSSQVLQQNFVNK